MTVEELLAREEIRHVMAVYNTAGDSVRFDEFRMVFTEDAVLSTPGLHFEGRDNIINELFSSVSDKTSDRQPPKFVRHNLTTSKITFPESGKAIGRTYFHVNTDVGLDHCGVYNDEFRQEADGWKIARRVVKLDYRSPDSRF